jgi:hypothetical protein
MNYRLILDDALREFSVLSKERDAIDGKLLKLRHFIYATLNMLPEPERNVYQAEIAMLASQVGNLTDSIREVLKLASLKNCYFTAAEVRDHLNKAGFDFSQYTSNPLASVSTILRRFKPDEVETSKRDGVTAYKWIALFPEPSVKLMPRRAIEVPE